MTTVGYNKLPTHSVFNTDKFSCLACHVSFSDPQMQRIHMKTEWHRYNLKRRVANLPSVTAEVFEQKVALQIRNKVEVDDFGFIVNEDLLKSQKAKGQSHLKSKRVTKIGHHHHSKHPSHLVPVPGLGDRELSPARSEVSQFSIGTILSGSESFDTDDITSTVSKLSEDDSEIYYVSSAYNSGDETDAGDLTDEEELPVKLSLEECFYCGEVSADIESNAEHMFRWHGLYIPYPEELVDRNGLLRILADVVGIEKTCLKCGYEATKLVGIRQHIKSKGHAVIPYETTEERELWSRFYESDETGVDNYDDLEKDELLTAKVDSTGVELSLPNGYKLGHRSMARYYKQFLPLGESEEYDPTENTVAVVEKKAQDVLFLRQKLIEKSEAKRIGKIETRERSKNLSSNALKYKNNIENYRNQRFG